MKNLPQFMEMLSMMYFGAKGKKLPYNKEAVLAFCGKYGCKGGTSKKYKQTTYFLHPKLISLLMPNQMFLFFLQF